MYHDWISTPEERITLNCHTYFYPNVNYGLALFQP